MRDMTPMAAGRPRILLNTWRRSGTVFGPTLRTMFGVEVQYVEFIRRAGGLPFLAPFPSEQDAPVERPGDVLAGFDGLMLIGGEDLAAEVSGASAGTIGIQASGSRDRWEIGLLHSALAADLPVLAICRGMQQLNVYLGGTLIGDISNSSPEHPSVSADTNEALAYRHDVVLEPGSRISRLLDSDRLATNSLHHQALDQVGSGLRVVGRATDGVIEAVELPSATWCVGVQWHPELMPGDRQQTSLALDFVAACRAIVPRQGTK